MNVHENSKKNWPWAASNLKDSDTLWEWYTMTKCIAGFFCLPIPLRVMRCCKALVIWLQSPKKPRRRATFRGLVSLPITDILENYRKHPAFLAIRICMNFPGRWNCLQVASRSHSTLGSTCGSTQRGSGIFPLGIVAKWKFFSKSERCISQHLHHVLWCDSVFNSRLAYLWEEENLKTCVTFKFGSLRFNIMNWRRRRGIWHHAKGVKCNLQLKTYPDPFYKV